MAGQGKTPLGKRGGCCCRLLAASAAVCLSADAPPFESRWRQACIDQKGDIDASLKVLPIFLLTSKTLCVLAGKSYTTRLWCIIEMFTFIRAGGSLDRISVYAFDPDAAMAVATFDVCKADCTVQHDKQRLLAIVESSFGTFGEFNNTCRRIFLRKLGGADSSLMDQRDEPPHSKVAGDVLGRRQVGKGEVHV